MEQDQAPIVTVPKAAAPDRGSVDEQIQEQWAELRKYIDPLLYDGSEYGKAIRKLDALIGYDDAK